MTRVAVAVAVAWLLGSVPFALLAARIKGVDLRLHGSGNLGATNAIRVLGPVLGVPVLIADVAKGWIAAAVIPRLSASTLEALPLACGAAAILGHVASPFLRFRGGKGVAAAAGVFLALAPQGLAVAAAVFAAVLLITRYVSLASMAGAAALPVALVALRARTELVAAGAVLAVLVAVRHRANVARMLRGTEHRATFRRRGAAP
ncbi:MAG: glycerol-3-phosphate 1-O-acyltransferase PlsY [Candidatus Eiseniibacteriota bacterium]